MLNTRATRITIFESLNPLVFYFLFVKPQRKSSKLYAMISKPIANKHIFSKLLFNFSFLFFFFNFIVGYNTVSLYDFKADDCRKTVKINNP